MANEILPAGIGDLHAQEVLAAEYLMLLAEQGNPFTHPAFMFATGAPGSNVVRVRHIGLGNGYNLLASATPGSEVANTALTDGSTDVTVARYSKRYFRDDLTKFMAAGLLNAELFAQDAAVAVTQTLLNLVANVTDGFAATVGTTTVDLLWSDIVDAKTTLAIAKAAGRMLALLHPRQWGDLDTDSLSLGGVPQQGAGLQGAVSAGLEQYKGNFFGIDFFTSSQVPTANTGADRAGAVFTRGAVAIADVEYDVESDPNIVHLGRAIFERDRQGTYGATSYLTHAMLGTAMGIDAAGVSVISDA